VHDKAAAALVATEHDEKASPVLVAVVREFARKADKALELAGAGREREAVIELEQAGDSAKAAVEADSRATEDTTAAVLDAHLAICMQKASSRL
jgi:histidinol dehydrogenase